MQRAVLISSMTLVALLLASGQMQAQQPKQGLALAKKACAQCHAVEKGRRASPNPAAPRFEDIANIPGMTAMAMTVALRTSHATMPNVMLDSDELASVVAYILSLKRAGR